MAFTIASTAWAIAGSARPTAAATLRSSRFISRTICNALRRSRFFDAGLRKLTASSFLGFRAHHGIIAAGRGNTATRPGENRCRDCQQIDNTFTKPAGFLFAESDKDSAIIKWLAFREADALEIVLMNILNRLFEERFRSPVKSVLPLQGDLGRIRPPDHPAFQRQRMPPSALSTACAKKMSHSSNFPDIFANMVCPSRKSTAKTWNTAPISKKISETPRCLSSCRKIAAVTRLRRAGGRSLSQGGG